MTRPRARKPRPSLLVKPSGPRDRGIYANRRFRKGEPIEDVPVIVIPDEEWEHVAATVLYHYAFCFGEESEHVAIALGYGSLYNHSYAPNAACDTYWQDRRMRFVALRDIRKGEEITINYHGDPDSDEPLWFEVEE